MIAISLILLLAVVVVAVLSGFALHTVRGLRREVAGLRGDLAAHAAGGAAVPASRPAPALEDVRTAVADALTAEREREMAEARAFWAAQDARDDDVFGTPYGPAPGALPGCPDHEVSALDAALLDALLDEVTAAPETGPVLPRQPDRRASPAPPADPRTEAPAARGPGEHGPGERPTPAETAARPDAPPPAEPEALREPETPVEPRAHTEQADAEREARAGSADAGPEASAEAEAAARAAARRRHPSNPHHTLSGEPVAPGSAEGAAFVPAAGAEPGPGAGAPEAERTVALLAAVAEAGTELSDVRPGPLGTLDVYVFADGTTVCLAPGHRDTAERLAASLRAGVAPLLLGGSGVLGGYALTFACGDETVYVLADRVIASL
ncbi:MULTISPECIES: hypothetical protein [Streptomyces]|uniref:hypothetical protein n=1 Tax=Streptomyces TaxID=1883 RepID=UPI00224875E4|nr:hypothetical protein [Streptomyces sp. JHD 1]MCX2971175.1 hypothetical protein [Streptomyces sp. JHD 1]